MNYWYARPIYWAIYREFPHSEDNETVQKIIHSDLLSVVKVTFIDGVFFEHIEAGRPSPYWYGGLANLGFDVDNPVEPALRELEPAAPDD